MAVPGFSITELIQAAGHIKIIYDSFFNKYTNSAAQIRGLAEDIEQFKAKGDETQHLYVVSPTNLRLFIESAELSLSRWRSFGGWFATMEEL
jgi:hypothetical protein